MSLKISGGRSGAPLAAGPLFKGKKLDKEIKRIESEIGDSPVEVCYLLDAEGNTLHTSAGTSNLIDLNPILDKFSRTQLANATLIHNHPQYEASFTDEDIATAVRYGIPNNRVISPHAVYSLKIPAGIYPEGADNTESRNNGNRYYSETIEALMEKYYNSEIVDGIKNGLYSKWEAWHHWWGKVFGELGWEYKKEPRT